MTDGYKKFEWKEQFRGGKRKKKEKNKFTSRDRGWRCLRFPFWIFSHCGGRRDSLMVPPRRNMRNAHLSSSLSASLSPSLTFSCALPLNCPSRLLTTSVSFIWASQSQDTCTVSLSRSSLLLLLPGHSLHVCYSKAYFFSVLIENKTLSDWSAICFSLSHFYHARFRQR